MVSSVLTSPKEKFTQNAPLEDLESTPLEEDEEAMESLFTSMKAIVSVLTQEPLRVELDLHLKSPSLLRKLPKPKKCSRLP